MKSLGYFSKLMQFLKEVKVELSKISWPSLHELIGSSIVSLIIIVAFSIYLGVVDYGFAWMAKQIFIDFV